MSYGGPLRHTIFLSTDPVYRWSLRIGWQSRYWTPTPSSRKDSRWECTNDSARRGMLSAWRILITLISRKHCRRPAQTGYCKYLICLVRPSSVGRFGYSKRWTVCHDARIAHILTVVTIIGRRDLMGTVAVEEPLKIQSILWQAITSVADDIGPSSIARGV